MAKSQPAIVAAKRPDRHRIELHIESIAERVSESTGEPKGAISDLLEPLIDLFKEWLSAAFSCVNPKPLPPNPDPTPTPAETLAWSNAWKIKGRAEKAFNNRTKDYDAHTLRTMKNQIQRKRRRNNDPVDDDTAMEIARNALDAAIETPHAEIAATILAVQGK